MKARATKDVDSPPTKAPWMVWAGCALVMWAAVALVTCVRHADLRDEPDASVLTGGPQLDAGIIPELDSGLGTDAYLACDDRPLGDCKGTNDFPCAFESWVTKTAASCQESTGCKTNGWLEVKMASSGCAAAIGMDEPNDDIIACLLAEIGSVRCPCLQVESTYFFGYGNTGGCAGSSD